MRMRKMPRRSPPREKNGETWNKNTGSAYKKLLRDKKTEEKHQQEQPPAPAEEHEEDEDQREDDEEEEEYNVERIVDVRFKDDKRQFKVRWAGYGPEHDEWCFENDLFCDQLIHDFLRKQAQSAKDNQKKGKRKIASLGESSKEAGKDNEEGDDDDDDDVEYEVEKIIKMKMTNKKREFLIRWKGFGYKEDTWEPEENLNCSELMEEFIEKMEQAKSVTASLRSNPKPTNRFNLANPQVRASRRHAGKERKTYYDNE